MGQWQEHLLDSVTLLGLQSQMCEGKFPTSSHVSEIIIMLSQLTIFIHLTNTHLVLALGQAFF